MTTLVTGGTGFLGTALVRRLVADGTGPLRILVRPGSDTHALDAACAGAPAGSVEYFTGTLDSVADAAAALQGVATVHHLAAAMRGTTADVFRGTLATSRHLLDAILAMPAPPRVVLVSSFGVYGTSLLADGACVDESTPLEPSPAKRDAYSQAKLEQERMFRDAHRRHGLPLVVLRPGVVYGPGGGALSSRIGMHAKGLFLRLGGDAPLPLAHVDNCADAIAIAATATAAAGSVFNVVDDDLPTCAGYLRQYRASVRRMAVVPVPYPLVELGSRLLVAGHRLSKGRVPALLTPYIVRSMYRPFRYSNAALKSIGWMPRVATREGMLGTFASLRVRPG